LVAELIGIVSQPTIVRLMPALSPPGREFSRFSFLSVDGGFDELRDVLSGRQLNQLLLFQALQTSAIHAHMDSEIGVRGKGDAEIRSGPPDRRGENGGGKLP
jgi:hypothetical protein